MHTPRFQRLPNHIGIIPDGNRRWAQARDLGKEMGYAAGLQPAFKLYEACIELGIPEVSVYGFTSDNTKRPSEQTNAFRQACVEAVEWLKAHDAALLIVGNDSSPLFPEELKPFTTRQVFGEGRIKVNLLVNYDWNWDISHSFINTNRTSKSRNGLLESIGSSDVSRIDLIIRWGGRRRLSGFLPVQSVYADFYVIDDLWPDFTPEHLYAALKWYEEQDVTLGG